MNTENNDLPVPIFINFPHKDTLKYDTNVRKYFKKIIR